MSDAVDFSCGNHSRRLQHSARSVRWEATQDVLDDAIEKHSPMPSMSARSPEQDVEALIADFNEQNAPSVWTMWSKISTRSSPTWWRSRVALTLLWDERFERIEVRSPTCSDDVRRIESVTSFVSSETVSHLHEQFLQQALPPRDLSTEMAELRAQFSSHVVQFERAIEGLGERPASSKFSYRRTTARLLAS